VSSVRAEGDVKDCPAHVPRLYSLAKHETSFPDTQNRNEYHPQPPSDETGIKLQNCLFHKQPAEQVADSYSGSGISKIILDPAEDSEARNAGFCERRYKIVFDMGIICFMRKELYIREDRNKDKYFFRSLKSL